jgi:hypothetical protein
MGERGSRHGRIVYNTSMIFRSVRMSLSLRWKNSDFAAADCSSELRLQSAAARA